MQRSVLFVCRGNVYRSQVAEYLFNNMFKGMKSRSAGISDLHAGKTVRRVFKEHNQEFVGEGIVSLGIETLGKKCKLVTKEDVEKADWIFVMETPQIKILAERFPESASKIHLLGKFAHLKDPEIRDMPVEPDFRKTVAKIRKALSIIKKRRLLEKDGD